MRRLLLCLLPIMAYGLGASPSQDPRTGLGDGSEFPSGPTITGVTCTVTPDELEEGVAESSSVVCDVTHNGYMGTARFSLVHDTSTEGDEGITGISNLTYGTRVDANTVRFVTNGVQLANYEGDGAKTGEFRVYPGNASTSTTCSGGGCAGATDCVTTVTGTLSGSATFTVTINSSSSQLYFQSASATGGDLASGAFDSTISMTAFQLGDDADKTFAIDCNGDGDYGDAGVDVADFNDADGVYSAAGCPDFTTSGIKTITLRAKAEAGSTCPGLACATSQVQLTVNPEAVYTQCNDGLDNDGEGGTDLADAGCGSNAANDNESPQCQDGVDNDVDTATDLADVDCVAADDNDESGTAATECDNGLDDDGDGDADWDGPGAFDPDAGCGSNAAAPIEDPRCDNGLDDDTPPDELIDYPDDPGCLSASDDDEFDQVDPGVGVVFSDDFEGGTINEIVARWGTMWGVCGGSACVDANGDGTYEMSIETASRPGSTGTKSVKLAQTTGWPNPYLHTELPADYEQLYVRAWIKSGATTAFAHYGLRFGGWESPAGYPKGLAGEKGCFTQGDYVCDDSDERFVAIEVAPVATEWQSFFSYWDMQGDSCQPPSCYPVEGTGYYGREFFSGDNPPFVPNQWQCVQVMIKMNTDAAEETGELALWINGNLIQHYKPGSPVGAYTASGNWVTGAGAAFPGLQLRDRTSLGLNFAGVQNFEGESDLYVDDFAISTEPLDCTGTVVDPPADLKMDSNEVNTRLVTAQMDSASDPGTAASNINVQLCNTGGTAADYTCASDTGVLPQGPFETISNSTTGTLAAGQCVTQTWAFDHTGITSSGTWQYHLTCSDDANVAAETQVTYRLDPPNQQTTCTPTSGIECRCSSMNTSGGPAVCHASETLNYALSPTTDHGWGDSPTSSPPYSVGDGSWTTVNPLTASTYTNNGGYRFQVQALYDSTTGIIQSVPGSSVGLPNVENVLSVTLGSLFEITSDVVNFTGGTFCSRGYYKLPADADCGLFTGGQQPPMKWPRGQCHGCTTSTYLAAGGTNTDAFWARSTTDTLGCVISGANDGSTGTVWGAGATLPLTSGEPITIRDARGKWLRYEICWDHNSRSGSDANKLHTRQRATIVDTGQYGVRSRLSTSAYATSAMWDGEIIKLENSQNSGKTAYVSHGMLASTYPADENFWIGPAEEIEGDVVVDPGDTDLDPVISRSATIWANVIAPATTLDLATACAGGACFSVSDESIGTVTYAWTDNSANCSFSATNILLPTVTISANETCNITLTVTDAAAQTDVETAQVTRTAAPAAGNNFTDDAECIAYYPVTTGSETLDSCAAAGGGTLTKIAGAYLNTEPPSGAPARFRWMDAYASGSGGAWWAPYHSALADTSFSTFAFVRTNTSGGSSGYNVWSLRDGGGAFGWSFILSPTLDFGGWLRGTTVPATRPVVSPTTIYTAGMSWTAGETPKFYLNGQPYSGSSTVADLNLTGRTPRFVLGGLSNTAGDATYDNFFGRLSETLYYSTPMTDAQQCSLCRFGPAGDFTDRSAQCGNCTY